jgi:glucose/arabinose dehydrogenase
MWMMAFVVGVAVASAHADTLSTAGTPSPADTFTIDEDFVSGTGLTTDFRFLPDGRMVIINKLGNVFVRPAGGGALVLAGSFDVDTDTEKGLLGIAVHPDFATNHQLFFYYSADEATDAERNRVVMRTLGDDGQLSDEETPIVTGLRGPANHDGGALDVGPDGYLYVGVGDTGCNSNMSTEPPYTPTNYYATCLADDATSNGGGNGKILRVALDGSIPPTNPLVGATNVSACGGSCSEAIDPGMLDDARPDVFAWGFRNPFRLWVDPRTGLVWAGDVGEITYEEVDIVRGGRHYGWPWREGAKGHAVTTCRTVRVGTTTTGDPIMDQDCVEPVYYCRHNNPEADQNVDGGCTAITGGQIVDTCTWPAPFRGRYVFGDSSTSSLWTLVPNGTRDGIVGGRADFATIDGAPVAIRTGNDGALYVAVLPDRIVRIAPIAPVACTDGCLSDAQCDDGDACTTDSCLPTASLCRHDAIGGCAGTTTTTTLPPDGGCAAGDARAQVACLCAAPVAECAATTLPRGVLRRHDKACGLVALDVAGRRERRALQRAASLFERAARAAGKRRVEPTCGGAMAARLRELAGATRAILDVARSAQ